MEALKTPTPNSSRIDQMRQCPRFEKCSVPLCPLDPDWHKCSILDEDSVCYLQLEAVKPNSDAAFQAAGIGWMIPLVLAPLQAMSERSGRVRRQTERSKTTGSRMRKEPPWLRKECG